MGCTPSKSIPSKHQLHNDDQTGVSIASASDAPHALHISKSSLASRQVEEDVTPRESNRTNDQRVTSEDPHLEADLNQSSQIPLTVSYSDGLQITLQSDNASPHSSQALNFNNSYGSLQSSNASKSNGRRKSRRNGEATQRRPTTAINTHLSKARQRMSHERKRRKGSLSPPRQATKDVEDADDMPLLLDISDSKADLDVSHLGASGSSFDLLGSSSKSHSSKSNHHDSLKSGREKRQRPRRSTNKKKKVDLEHSLKQISAEQQRHRESSQASVSSRSSRNSKKSTSSGRSASKKITATKTSSSPRRPKERRPSFPGNEPRRKSQAVAPEPATVVEPQDPPKMKPVTAPAPEANAPLIANPTCELGTPPQHSLGRVASSQHSQGSLNNYLPQNMKAHPHGPKWMQTLGQSMSSLPSLSSFSTLPEQEEAKEEDRGYTVEQKRSSLVDLVQIINPLKTNRQPDFDGLMSDSSEDENEREEDVPKRSSGSNGSKLANVAKHILSISNTNKDKDDNASDSESTGEESEHSLDIFASSSMEFNKEHEDPVVFKFDASDPTIAQFDPLEAEVQQQMNNSIGAIDRIHLRQAVRGKRRSTRRHAVHDEFKSASLHSSFSQVDALKAVEARKAPRRSRPHAAHKHGRGRSRSQSMSTGKLKPKKEPSTEEMKDESTKENTVRDSSRPHHSATERRRHTEVSNGTSTPTRKSHRSTHAAAAASPRHSHGGSRATTTRATSPKQKRHTAPAVPTTLDAPLN